MIKRRFSFGIYINLFLQDRTNYMNLPPPPPPLIGAYSVSYGHALLKYNFQLHESVIHNYCVTNNTFKKFNTFCRREVILFKESIDSCIKTNSYIFIIIIDKLMGIS